MDETINLIIGCDERESIAFQLCSEHNFNTLSCKYNTTLSKKFCKYRENHKDGSNEFIF